MNTKKIIIWFSLVLLMISGCQSNLKSKIYETFFKDIVSASIIKIVNPDLKYTVIDGLEIEIIKSEMSKINDIREYSSNAQPLSYFKRGYRALYINKKVNIEKKKWMVLYSTEEQSMIVRKYDIFPDTKVKLPNITVYEFKIPQKVVDILSEHEKTLPNEGFFIGSWPLDMEE